MIWPPESDAEKRAHLARQIRNDPTMREIESNRPLPPPAEPVTDEEKAKLRARRDEALAFIETFRPHPRKPRWVKIQRD